MSIRSSLLTLVIIIGLILTLFLLGLRLNFLSPSDIPLSTEPPIEKPPAEELPSDTFLFTDTYEENPTITKTNHDLWVKFTSDAKNGNYWADQVRWLEVGTIPLGKKYQLAPPLGEAKVIEELSHEGKKSTELTIYKVPEGYIQANVGVARYFRDKSIVRDGTYEVGAWFYVPKGYTPYYVHVSIENHLSWKKGYFAHIGVNPEDSTVVVADQHNIPETKIVDNISFQYETWFKLWIMYDSKNPTELVGGYKSPTEEKTWELDVPWVIGPDLAYVDLPGFNFYATGHNLPGRPRQKLYVDDFYVKIVGQK
jgi:hypothetical protein